MFPTPEVGPKSGGPDLDLIMQVWPPQVHLANNCMRLELDRCSPTALALHGETVAPISFLENNINDHKLKEHLRRE